MQKYYLVCELTYIISSDAEGRSMYTQGFRPLVPHDSQEAAERHIFERMNKSIGSNVTYTIVPMYRDLREKPEMHEGYKKIIDTWENKLIAPHLLQELRHWTP